MPPNLLAIPLSRKRASFVYRQPRPAVATGFKRGSEIRPRLSTDDDENPATEQRSASKGREVEPLGTDDFLAQLFLRDAFLAHFLVQAQAYSLDRNVLLALVLAEGPHHASGEEATSTDSDEEIRSVTMDWTALASHGIIV